MATVLVGRVGFVDSIVLVFCVHLEGARRLEEAASWIAEWIAESAAQGSVVWKGTPKFPVPSAGTRRQRWMVVGSSRTDISGS
jgi:hypothetical protein